MLSGDSLSAIKAYELGLVDDIVGEDVFEEKCVEIARKMSQNSPSVVRLTKRIIKGSLNDLEAYLKMESELIK